MKSIIITLLVAAVTLCANAQKDVTKFLGIPVDGSKTEMIRKLKAKGFKSSSQDKNILEGIFNGRKVNVFINTNGNKVCRLMVCDADLMDERSIQIRFNTLCSQFSNNPKYVSLLDNELIPEDEDIAREIIIKNKRYDAIFFQKPEQMLDTAVFEEYIKTVCGENDLANLSPEKKDELTKQLMDISLKKPVWFMISNAFGKYYISMFYDNEYNRANGEDL